MIRFGRKILPSKMFGIVIDFVFLNMGKIKSTKTNYAIPGDPMSQQDFEQMIQQAEKGPFHSIKFVKAELAKWKAKYAKS